MIQVLLLTRGGLGDEWLLATAAVCGHPAEGIESLGLGWDGSCESDRAHVSTTIARLRRRAPLLVLTDLHGSTPTNLAAEQAVDPDVVVVAGANLAMVLRLACEDRSQRSLDELSRWICDKGRSAIRRIEPSETESEP